MEKISGILPATSRVSTVDLESSGSVRPGAPNYGRPVGTSTLGQQSAVNHIKQDSIEELKSKAIDGINRDFFMNKPKVHKAIEQQVNSLPSLQDITVMSPVDQIEQKWEEATTKGDILNLEA